MKVNLKNIAIVLNEPHYPENIGAAARAAKNMGIESLVLVNPIDCNLSRILQMATHHAEDVVTGMEVYDSLEETLATFQYVVGTTARLGSHRGSVKSPGQLARDLIEISRDNRVAVLFGTESRGLANEDIRYCDALVNIPTSDFSSINLAQSVMVLAYEIFTASTEEKQPQVPRLATRGELEGMYGHVKEILTRINFINPENPDYWMTNVRQFFSRLHLRGGDVRLIRGICRQIDWYCTKKRGDAPPEVQPEPRRPLPEGNGR